MTFNQASVCYLRPLGYAVHPRYGAKAPSRSGNSSASFRGRDKQH
ncbi:hypothetical protein [Lactococcus protaetiae]|nr:hypothetical protein [Lactococcus protaetiae]